VAWGVGGGIVRLDAFEVGDLDAARVQAGEWWRALTALTLHLDPAHLAANLGAGTWFGYLSGRLLGSGIAWMLIVAGAGAANLLEGLLANPAHRAAGASTAVFSALGLMAVYSWRRRRRLHRHWAARLSPLVAGVVLLGWTGSEGEHTDVFAHLAGFAFGGALGALAAIPALHRALSRVPQWIAGTLALGSLTAAWACGLRS
jgi:membrane associated rhomboid family serine protease